MVDFIKNNLLIINIFISLIIVVGTIFQTKIMIQKHQIDKDEFTKKKNNFSIFLENCYRVSYSSSKKMNVLFSVMITNRSSNRNTFIPKLEIHYIDNNNLRNVKLTHNYNLFEENFHKEMNKFANSIPLDGKDIKSGWIIFQIPDDLRNKRIEKYRVIIQDGDNNISDAESLLIKDIHYND